MYDLESLISGFVSNIFAFYRSKKKKKKRRKRVNYGFKIYNFSNNLIFKMNRSKKRKTFKLKKNKRMLKVN